MFSTWPWVALLAPLSARSFPPSSINVVMPPLGVLIRGVNCTDLSIVLKEAEGEATEVATSYGLFIQSVVDFMKPQYSHW